MLPIRGDTKELYACPSWFIRSATSELQWTTSRWHAPHASITILNLKEMNTRAHERNLSPLSLRAKGGKQTVCWKLLDKTNTPSRVQEKKVFNMAIWIWAWIRIWIRAILCSLFFQHTLHREPEEIYFHRCDAMGVCLFFLFFLNSYGPIEKMNLNTRTFHHC